MSDTKPCPHCGWSEQVARVAQVRMDLERDIALALPVDGGRRNTRNTAEAIAWALIVGGRIRHVRTGYNLHLPETA